MTNTIELDADLTEVATGVNNLDPYQVVGLEDPLRGLAFKWEAGVLQQLTPASDSGIE